MGFGAVPLVLRLFCSRYLKSLVVEIGVVDQGTIYQLKEGKKSALRTRYFRNGKAMMTRLSGVVHVLDIVPPRAISICKLTMDDPSVCFPTWPSMTGPTKHSNPQDPKTGHHELLCVDSMNLTFNIIFICYNGQRCCDIGGTLTTALHWCIPTNRV